MMGLGIAFLVLLALAAGGGKTGGSPASLPGAPRAPGAPGSKDDSLPPELQRKLAEVLRDLTVDPISGQISGPISASAVQAATALAGELERAGFAAAATALRAYAQAAASLVPKSPPPASSGAFTAEELARLQSALKMERDLSKLEAILAALKQRPESSERDQFIAAFNALILQVKADIAKRDAARKLAELEKPPATPGAPPSAPPVSPPAPVRPPAPVAPSAPIASRTYVVQASDRKGPWGLALAWTGNGNVGFAELKAANPQLAKLWDAGKNWYAGLKINIPARWPAMPGAPAPSAPAPSAPAPSAAPANVYVIRGDDGIGPKGPYGLAQAKTGNGGRWRELIPVNPQKRLRPDGSNFLYWTVGEPIRLPDSWVTGAAPPVAPGVPAPPAPIAVPSSPQPQALPEAKAPIEIAADSMVRNLRSVQASRGARGAQGKEDQSLVRRFQTLAGGSADGRTGPGTLLAAAKAGQSNLPAVMYWPKATSVSTAALRQSLLEYRAALQALANQARAEGLDSRAIELEASLSRELAQGDQRGPLSV